MNPADLVRLGLDDGELVDVIALRRPGAATDRVAHGFRIVSFPTPVGNVAAYFPESNVLIDVMDRSPESGTPSFKSILVELRRSRP